MPRQSTPKRTLFIGATHGDEPIGVAALRRLDASSTVGYDWIVGNERAFIRGTRYTEQDLNRSAPGDPVSDIYEARRAAEVLALAKTYDYTIDIHGTIEPTGIFIIITNPRPENWQLAASLPIDRIVYWPSITPELAGPLSEYVPCGLEIECGVKSDPAILDELVDILKQGIPTLSKGLIDLPRATEVLKKREIYEVTGSLPADENDDRILREFQPIVIGDKTVYPLLVGTYRESYGLDCFIMEKRTIKAYL